MILLRHFSKLLVLNHPVIVHLLRDSLPAGYVKRRYMTLVNEIMVLMMNLCVLPISWEYFLMHSSPYLWISRPKETYSRGNSSRGCWSTDDSERAVTTYVPSSPVSNKLLGRIKQVIDRQVFSNQ